MLSIGFEGIDNFFEYTFLRISTALSNPTTDVELELFSFQDVSVHSSGLTRSGRDASIQSTGNKLVSQGRVDLRVSLSGLDFSQNVLRLLFFLLFFFLLILLLLADGFSVVRLIVLFEGSGIDLDDAVFHESLSSDQLVVGGVVHDVDDTGLSGDGFGTPGEVSVVHSEGLVLHVSSSASDGVHSLGADFGDGGLTAHLRLSFLLVDGSLASGGRSLVSAVSADTHGGSSSLFLFRLQHSTNAPHTLKRQIGRAHV